jgi:uncharacterized protein
MQKTLAFCVLFLVIANARSASFVCKRATTEVEKTIRSDSHLSALDHLLRRYYMLALDAFATPGILKDKQRRWLTENRNVCKDSDCLRDEYDKRLADLKTIISYGTNQRDDHTGKSDAAWLRQWIPLGVLCVSAVRIIRSWRPWRLGGSNKRSRSKS